MSPCSASRRNALKIIALENRSGLAGNFRRYDSYLGCEQGRGRPGGGVLTITHGLFLCSYLAIDISMSTMVAGDMERYAGFCAGQACMHAARFTMVDA